MDSVNRTLYIPLYGKALVSRRGILLSDPKAEEIWGAGGFPLKGKAASKWLAYYMGMRSAVFDRWVEEKLEAYPEAVVLHLGCGLDSRCLRVNRQNSQWFDVDFPDVIRERKRFFPETECSRMIEADLREGEWLDRIPGGKALVVMEGVSMYLMPEELAGLLKRITERFDRVELLMDCYTSLAAKLSRYKNPINEVGVTRVYGLDDPRKPAEGSAFRFLQELDMTPEDMIAELPGKEQWIFRKLYAGNVSRNMYRLYSYAK